MSPKIDTIVSRVEHDPSKDPTPVNYEATVKLAYGVSPSIRVGVPPKGAQVLYLYEDSDEGLYAVGQRLTEDAIEFLLLCEDGVVPAWAVTTSVTHRKTGALLAEDYVVVHAVEEPYATDPFFRDRAIGKYTDLAASAAIWFDEMRKKTPEQEDIVSMFLEYGPKMKG